MKRFFVVIGLFLAIVAMVGNSWASWCWDPSELKFSLFRGSWVEVVPGGKTYVGVEVASIIPGTYEGSIKFKVSPDWAFVDILPYSIGIDMNLSITTEPTDAYILNIRGDVTEKAIMTTPLCAIGFRIPQDTPPGAISFQVDVLDVYGIGKATPPCTYKGMPEEEEMFSFEDIASSYSWGLFVLSKGDMDEDHSVSFNDVVRLYFWLEDIKKKVGHSDWLVERNRYLGDMNSDGKLTVDDLIALYKLSKMCKCEVVAGPPKTTVVPVGLKKILGLRTSATSATTLGKIKAGR